MGIHGIGNLKPDDSSKPQRMVVCLNILAAKETGADHQVFSRLSQVALDLSHIGEAATVSMYPYDEENMDQEEFPEAVKTYVADDSKHEEFFPGGDKGLTEGTMFRVREALAESGIDRSGPWIDMAINAMQNAGILFRERV